MLQFLPHQVKKHFRFHANYFLLAWKISEEVDDQWSSITKGSIYHIKHNYVYIFYHSSELTRNLTFLMEVSSMHACFIFSNTSFLLGEAELHCSYINYGMFCFVFVFLFLCCFYLFCKHTAEILLKMIYDLCNINIFQSENDQ